MEFIKSPRVLTIIVLATLFTLGLLSGWSLGSRYGTRKFDRLTNLTAELKPEVLEDHAIRGLTSKLDLSSEQVQKIRPIIASGLGEVIELRKESLKKIYDCRNRGLDQIALQLTPEQQVKLRDFMRKRDEELQQQLKNN